MNSVWRIASLLALAACTLAQPKQDQKKGRDLKYEENNTATPSSAQLSNIEVRNSRLASGSRFAKGSSDLGPLI